jgi:DNA-binding transcriptional ArsR family regulator
MSAMFHIDKAFQETPILDEEEIFKSLSHPIRRKIIKVLGEQQLTFTDIKKDIEAIDSPTLSYHLKSMQPLLNQKDNKYSLSEVGMASLLLLNKTDQSVKISKYRRNFLYAYIGTVICWTVAETVVPFILGPDISTLKFSLIQTVITAISVVNFLIIWQLRKRYE